MFIFQKERIILLLLHPIFSVRKSDSIKCCSSWSNCYWSILTLNVSFEIHVWFAKTCLFFGKLKDRNGKFFKRYYIKFKISGAAQRGSYYYYYSFQSIGLAFPFRSPRQLIIFPELIIQVARRLLESFKCRIDSCFQQEVECKSSKQVIFFKMIEQVF